VKDRFVTEPYPAWTAVDIDRLYSDNAVAEIEVVARARPAAN
jgi:enamine deaminase RidA (YjgF/YER057c/UK114 family)